MAKINIKSFDIMFYDTILFRIIVKDNKPVSCTRFCGSLMPDPLHNKLTMEALYDYFAGRTFDVNRPDMPELLKLLKLPKYEPYMMVRLLHGICCDDGEWCRFEDESNLTYEDAVKDVRDRYSN
jgi:hypothetical protein